MSILEDKRFFVVAALLLLAFMGGVMICSVLGESLTADEGIHLTAGYVNWKSGNYFVNWEHPPLAKMMSALPLLPLEPRLATEHESWLRGNMLELGRLFLYANRIPPEKILFLGRLPTIMLTLIFGVVLLVWSRTHFGPAVALLALFLFALDPNLIAHGRYVTTDMAAAAFIFFTCIAWGSYLQSRRKWLLIASGVLLGLAFAAKFSTVFLAGIVPLLYLIRWWQKPRSCSIPHFAVSMLVVAALSVLALATVYLPETMNAFFLEDRPPLMASVPPGSAVYWLAEKTQIPAHAYLIGLSSVEEHNRRGHPMYLLGEASGQGSWYYFPVAMAVKTPTAVLLLLLIALGLAGLAFRNRIRIRQIPFVWFVLIIPPAIYLAMSMSSQINIGLRHVLPVYPFLIVAVSAAVARRKFLLPLALLLCLQVVEHARIFPHYLAFFNTISGGPEKGLNYLADSNLDWGQDLIKLRNYVNDNRIDKIYLEYFGSADESYHLPAAQGLRQTLRNRSPKEIDGVVAISAMYLTDVFGSNKDLEWFLNREPDARLGYSIFIYDMRKGNDAGNH